ncbi:MAG: hypothetical protein ACP5HU_12110 [Phycisphaerae bacterium]
MVYRIRYRKSRGASEGELVVEANSPSEAMVKFRHVHAETQRPAEVVTSVVPEDADGDAPADEDDNWF